MNRLKLSFYDIRHIQIRRNFPNSKTLSLEMQCSISQTWREPCTVCESAGLLSVVNRKLPITRYNFQHTVNDDLESRFVCVPIDATDGERSSSMYGLGVVQYLQPAHTRTLPED